MNIQKKSFFERLTGGIKMHTDDENEDDNYAEIVNEPRLKPTMKKLTEDKTSAVSNEKAFFPEEDEEDEGQLTVDVYQTPNDIVLQTMVAGVRPDSVAINISRDMITIKGKREESKIINEENYFLKELYWGSFSRTILLPQEIIPEEAEATERHGLLTIKMPKIDKDKKTTLRIKSV